MSGERDRMLRRIADSLRTACLPDSATAPQAAGEPPAPLPTLLSQIAGEPPAPLLHDVSTTPAPVSQAVGDATLEARFAEELAALTGRTYVAADLDEAVRTIQGLIARTGSTRVLCWDEAELEQNDLLSRLVSGGVEVLRYELPSDPDGRRHLLADLDPVQVGLTGAVAGLADTGSLVLTSGPGRGRLVSLLPPVHVAVLSKRRLYSSLPAFLSAHPGIVAQGSNLVIVTGPSRTADIEMTLTHGVHGPREVHVILTP
jgi:L-lactate dehydrogenase complex protein LldG